MLFPAYREHLRRKNRGFKFPRRMVRQAQSIPPPPKPGKCWNKRSTSIASQSFRTKRCTFLLLIFIVTLHFYLHAWPAVCSFAAQSPEKVDTNNLPFLYHCVLQTDPKILDIPKDRSHMLRNDWFIEDPQNEETVTLLALVINISPFTQTHTARFVENVKSKTFLTFFQKSFITAGNVSPFLRQGRNFGKQCLAIVFPRLQGPTRRCYPTPAGKWNILDD